MDATRLRVIRNPHEPAPDTNSPDANSPDDREISVLISDETFDRLVIAIERGLTPRAGLAESVFDE